ncbi:protein-L-isoaspartate O-methyltransferase family protein [Oligella urethralis]|uniref:Protein-L-isoaspartate O-methyltransferase n=1 Tax=Oligella urethralis DNF00040 TaxID=1401065 RepID=A0A095Z9Q3_9BURK|nr:protein-L-isoaspartate O-methyltransferase [Oligella urethralis]KGF31505.1 protein-L-isoaspartate O-methyltransferase [Oligella urethralis DNF00040]
MNKPINSLELSRYNMVEQQIRPWGILDDKVLDALLALDRTRFMDPKYHNIAFADLEVPIEVDGSKTGESMLCPKMEALFAQELQLQPEDSVLEIGTGSGFQAALLSRLCRQVHSVEIDSRIAAQAQKNLRQAGITNVQVEVGDGHAGWGNNEFNAILVTGSVPTVADSLKYQLAIGGRLIITVGQAPLMEVHRIVRTDAANFESEVLLESYIKPLRGAVASNFKF